ncbi:hypothetical protein SAMN04488502_11335 [Dendrosporobacter quercicolus]|uniref:Uncharacterized protein n=1 Tax=Dendrosporobacter quercicolus TaxID=146817 RepID=A0A1G9Z4B0_9FIRM|nr:hypothetical protein SAMN04488502_11335 [Dendrosporobacter quercicolus]
MFNIYRHLPPFSLQHGLWMGQQPVHRQSQAYKDNHIYTDSAGFVAVMNQPPAIRKSVNAGGQNKKQDNSIHSLLLPPVQVMGLVLVINPLRRILVTTFTVISAFRYIAGQSTRLSS